MYVPDLESTSEVMISRHLFRFGDILTKRLDDPTLRRGTIVCTAFYKITFIPLFDTYYSSCQVDKE